MREAVRLRRILILVAAVLAIAASVALLVRTPSSEPAAPVVLAAASLQESLEAAADAWTAKGHRRPVLSFAATSALARQVEAGAPADVFISADEEWMDTLSAKGLIRSGSRATLAGNSLVLIAPVSSKTDLKIAPGMPLARALGSGRLALADPSGVPAGRYARQALERLGVWDQVSARVAAGDNVRAALSLVARGEAPLGVVYATDAKAEPKVRVIGTFPPASHTPITYPIALLQTARAPEAEPLRRFLLSPQAQAVFRRYGFTPAAR
ncbi:molybdate transport system substrate-binding protein [Novosphingobium chloroacetimidivorans]|uniref:Molybdate transport system substrate-binding protein n=1 Tax=Novosphingobium chloroacetimidivorans TaxID=1428314 RepID=A0A7W7NVG1_9SPHN|nr:molybdate ABC transporter substrate-binding protein [Novosphingobium chloroacetimidivorans]MBB4858488.1 molybdate transport system substrate-binding protein [Novosphingobium chloroacetimidivorans]